MSCDVDGPVAPAAASDIADGRLQTPALLLPVDGMLWPAFLAKLC